MRDDTPPPAWHPDPADGAQSVEADVRGHSNPHRKRDLIAAAVAGIVIVVGVLLIIFWPQQPTNKPDIGGVVQTSMQDFFDTDPGFASHGLTVVKVSVVRADGSRYDGVAVIRARNGADTMCPSRSRPTAGG